MKRILHTRRYTFDMNHNQLTKESGVAELSVMVNENCKFGGIRVKPIIDAPETFEYNGGKLVDRVENI